MRTKLILWLKKEFRNAGKYLQSEEFIFDAILMFFIIFFDYYTPKSKDSLIELLHHNQKYEFFVGMTIQIFISFNAGRYGQKLSKNKNLSGCLTTIGLGFLFFVFVFPALFIEQDGDSNFYLVLGTLLGSLVIILSAMIGYYSEKNFINLDKSSIRKIRLIFRNLLLAISYSALMLYRILLFDAMHLDELNTLSLIVVLIITGILPYRIILLFEPPVNYWSIFAGSIVILLSIF